MVFNFTFHFLFLSKECLPIFPLNVCYPLVVCILCKSVSINSMIRKQKRKKLDWIKETQNSNNTAKQGAKLIFTHSVSVCVCVRTNVSVSFEHFPIRTKNNKINAENLKVKRQLSSRICSLLLFRLQVCIYSNVYYTLIEQIQIRNVCQMADSMHCQMVYSLIRSKIL